MGLCLPMFLASCDSKDKDFPDFETQTVYFAKQYPVRTVELGNDDYVDLTNDNAHKVYISATMGGAYDNPRDITVDIAVDNSLCNGLKFKDNGFDVTPMPSNYYTLASNSIRIPKGEITASVEVQLTDAFFNDPLSLTKHYVIPVKMSNATGVDSIISAKNFTLYAVKYINAYHAVYVRQKENDADKDEEFKITTIDIDKALISYPLKDGSGNSYPCDLTLDFASGKITTNTEGYSVDGTVSFVSQDPTQMLGSKHPDTVYLKFTATNSTLGINETKNVALNVKYRGVVPETFEVTEE